MTAYRRALDTFVVELEGVPHGVQKGAVLPESDPVVRHDLANGGLLFAALDTSEDEKAPAKSAPAKAPEAEAKPAVKDSPPKAELAAKADPKAAAASRAGKGGA